MKKLLLLSLFFSISIHFFSRENISLNKDWSFHAGYLDKNESSRIDLPHTWNDGDALIGNASYYRGLCSYTKNLILNPQWKGKRLFLRFEGSNTVTNVFFNGKLIKEHQGGYSAFIVEITDFINFEGKNSIEVKVNNAPRLDIIPLEGDFNIYGGIYRDVNLIITGDICISPLHYASSGVYVTQKNITKENAHFSARVLLSGNAKSDEAVNVVFSLYDNETKVLIKSVKKTLNPNRVEDVNFELDLPKPHLWNGVKDPFLYKAVVTIVRFGKEIDRVEENIGFRFYRVDADKGFFLNGEHLRLKGVCRHQDRAELGNAISNVHHDEDLAIIREMGANAIRLSHYPQAKYFHQKLDKYGLIAWAEIPFVGEFVNSPTFIANVREQMAELIYQNYNHPSICFWGIFNEINSVGDNPLECVRELNDLIYSIDSTRLSTAATNSNDEFIKIPTLICWNRYDGWYYGEPKNIGKWADQTHKEHPVFKIGVSEYGAGASIYQHLDTIVKPEAGGFWHPENWQAYYHIENWKEIKKRDFLWGSFIWNMFDFAVAGRREGDKIGRNDKGLVTFDRKTKKDAFYFYKANWSEEPVLYIADRRNIDRARTLTNIQVYSNCDRLILKVNGKVMPSGPQENAVFEWKNISLKPGLNQIDVMAYHGGNKIADHCEWILNKN